MNVVENVAASLGAYLAVKLVRWVAREYIVWDGMTEVRKGLPEWAKS